MAELDEISRVQSHFWTRPLRAITIKSPELTSDWRVYDEDGVVTVVADGMLLTC